MKIVVIIPTLNEAANLGAALDELRKTGGMGVPVFVADCDSNDNTPEVAASRGAVVIANQGMVSRAEALRAGIDFALEKHPDTQAVWMLHADSTPPPGWRDAIEQTLETPRNVGGAFTQKFDRRGLKLTGLQKQLLHTVEISNRIRYRFTCTYFGDQGIFVRPEALKQVGGIPQLLLMEDVKLCQQLRKLGRVKLCKPRMLTSPRRFLKNGIMRQFFCDWWMLIGQRFGKGHCRLHESYNAENRVGYAS